MDRTSVGAVNFGVSFISK